MASHTRRAFRRLVAAGMFVLMVGSVVPPAQATTGTEKAVHVLINEARGNSGRRLLTLSERLSRIAHRHSKQMATRGTLFHSCLSCVIGSARRLGENVGYGAGPVEVQGQFMASPPHRANILDRKYRKAGVGVVRRGGLVWVTQVFAG